MNAMSARDGCPRPGTHIPGLRRPRSRMKRVHTTAKKNPQQEDNPHDPTEDPITPKPKESTQPPELKTSKQMKTALRQMKPLTYLTFYS